MQLIVTALLSSCIPYITLKLCRDRTTAHRPACLAWLSYGTASGQHKAVPGDSSHQLRGSDGRSDTAYCEPSQPVFPPHYRVASSTDLCRLLCLILAQQFGLSTPHLWYPWNVRPTSLAAANSIAKALWQSQLEHFQANFAAVADIFHERLIVKKRVIKKNASTSCTIQWSQSRNPLSI